MQWRHCLLSSYKVQSTFFGTGESNGYMKSVISAIKGLQSISGSCVYVCTHKQIYVYNLGLYIIFNYIIMII